LLLTQGIFYNPHKFIRKLMPGLDTIFRKYNIEVRPDLQEGWRGLEVIVTSCGDRQHSIDSMHHLAESKAIDIRPPVTGVSDVLQETRALLARKGQEYGIRYLLLTEGDHWHIQQKE